MRILIPVFAVAVLSQAAAGQKTVSFPAEDGGVVFADEYGTGDKSVILAHGGQFSKESWAKQAQILSLDSTYWPSISAVMVSRMARAIPIPWMRPFTSMCSRQFTTSAKMGRGACRSWGAAWEEAPREMHRSVPRPVRSIAWYCLVPLRMIGPTNSSRQFCMLWRAMTRAAMVRAFPRFGSSTTDRRSPKS
jgi:hypothetical protein